MIRLIPRFTIAALIMFSLLFLAYCSGSPPVFKRMEVPADKSAAENVLKKYSLKRYQVNQDRYVYSASEGATFKGEMLYLTGKETDSKRLDFQPGLNGTYGIYIDIQIFAEETVKLKILQNKKTVLEQTFTKNGVYAINPAPPLNLTKDCRVTLDISGKGMVLLARPVFYSRTRQANRQYVFIICADTLRADHLPVYGYHRNTAPNIAEFSHDAVVFENAFSQSPWTMPSHMSLFTALYEYNHGVKKDSVLDPSLPFLVEALARTFSVRSINGGGYVNGTFGFYRGFDYYKSYGRCGAKPDSAKWLFTLAIEDLERNPLPAAFYFLHSYQIHAPYRPPRRFLNHFNRSPQNRNMNTPLGMNTTNTSRELLEQTRKNVIDLYDGEIRTFDHWFGEFIRYLKKKGLYRNAMIIFLSDHGEEFYEHKGWGHSHALYNEVTRVPLIIKFPDQKYKGKRIRSNAGLIDVMPTVLHYYSLDRQNQNPKSVANVELDGRDLMTLINGERFKRVLTSSITSGLYYKTQPFKIALIENFSKIILNMPHKKALSGELNLSPRGFEFYDLVEDPVEAVNLYLQKMRDIESLYPLFESIILKARFIIKNEGNKAEIDQKTKDALKSLGYL